MNITRQLSAFIISLCLAFGAATAYGSTEAPQSNTELKQAFKSAKKTIVFFANPYGAPCRAQNDIIQKLHSDRGKKFNVVLVDATKPADQKVFYDYGVRGLPSVVVVDSAGKIGKVFAPGIQSYQTLSQILDSLQ